ncbi:MULTISPECIES: hypothetical protein [Pseudomonadaceae]|jgi:hypothetical protein|uniref:Uncharacterized protein n=3 Tax=Metapseudomonas otitidis TaxID=319939 RepID=A0A1I0UKQ8_9GAMM|nr:MULTISPECIES: hypothetical protein [Pseudomonas]KIV71746.1 hypothetical protein SZ55_2242 [Pseudomonas sp. FeS53a]MBO2929436.1 hypothetical protein [Pseudomonas otitidis]MDH0335226.1 hypothetical protein [Pseudomonas otitidis]MDU9397997.1 hypothetical protein [Pseudomonas sp. zfem003]MDV3441995.1 hypothetical protein [Pseudomonas otitidis]
MTRRTRPPLRIAYSPLQLVLCIALGIWLGAVAVVATAWLGYQAVVAQAWSQASGRAALPSIPPADAPAPQVDKGSEMFQHYQERLDAAQQRDNERAEARDRAQSPQCQFWREQQRNAPTEKARQNVERFCQ